MSDYFVLSDHRHSDTIESSPERYRNGDWELYWEYDEFSYESAALGACREDMQNILGEKVPPYPDDAGDETYLVVARFDDKFKRYHYDGDTTSYTNYDVIRCELEDLEDVAAMLSEEGPERIVMGRELSMFPE